MVEDFYRIQNISPIDQICEACICGKQARLPFAKAKSKVHINRPLFIIHSDVCGKINPSTIDNKNYFVSFIDEYTHYTVVYLITYKSDVLNAFKDFVAKSEVHFNLKIENLYCDNGREYLSNEFKLFCSEKGITFHLTVPYTPQQNSVAERMNRTITEMARALVIAAELPKTFWGEAVLTAVYLINRSPTKALKTNKTPYELWHNQKPLIKHLRVFGSTVYVHNKTRDGKFDSKSYKGILVGYDPNGYKIWIVETEQFIKARDVKFDETSYKKTRPPLLNTEVTVSTYNSENNTVKPRSVPETVSQTSKINNPDLIKTGSSVEQLNKSDFYKADVGHGGSNHNNESAPTTNNMPVHNKPEIRRSERLSKLPKLSYDENVLNMYNLNTYMLSIDNASIAIPKCYKEIPNRHDRFEWEKAIEDELKSLQTNNTWLIVPKPENKNIVGCRWVFTLKNDEYGNPVKYKARLVAKGFSQEYLSDYTETFAPVARISTFRLILAISNQYNLIVHHMDVKTAFLNGFLKEEIYMDIPEGIKAENGYVCKLNKSIYGLKQSARCWFERFDLILKQLSFSNSEVDRCLYFLDKGHINENIYLILYVDDLVIATGNINTMHSFKAYLMKQFNMVDLHDIKLFLGIKIERTDNKITLNQSTYLKSILSKFNMSNCKSISSPLPNKINYTALNSEEFYEAPCKNLLGCLMYAMLCTRPDICAAVNILSRYQIKNNIELWRSLKRILRYIKGTLNFKLTYIRNDFKQTLTGYVDADWANDDTTRRSTTGYVFQIFDNCTVTWNTKRQNSVATSSTEAEYMALYEGVKEAIWIKSVFKSINLDLNKPIVIYEDNQSCISIATNPSNHKRTKHIDIKYHFTREQIEQQIVTLKYVPTDHQLADIFTKMVSPVKFAQIRSSLGLIE